MKLLVLLLQLRRDLHELVQRRLKIFSDLRCDHIRFWQVCRIFQAVIFQPEDIQAHLVAFNQLIVAEYMKAFAFLTLVPVLRFVARDEVIEVGPLQRVRLQREVLIRAEVIESAGSRRSSQT